MSELEIPEEIDNFFDKDHIIFYINDDGELKCQYTMFDLEKFQDLIVTVLKGGLNDDILTFLSDDMYKKKLIQESVSMLVLKQLLNNNEETSTPVIKPSNFK